MKVARIIIVRFFLRILVKWGGALLFALLLTLTSPLGGDSVKTIMIEGFLEDWTEVVEQCCRWVDPAVFLLIRLGRSRAVGEVVMDTGQQPG